MFEVNHGEPVPKRRYALYPFAQMEIGDHFDAPRDMGKCGRADARQNSLSCSAVYYARGTGKKFTVRLVDDNVVRCWRIA